MAAPAGWRCYFAQALTGAGMAAAFSPLMTAVLMRVPVSDAADATGVIVTVNQLALVIGVATFGTLYLNLAGQLPAHGAHDSFTLISAHAVAVTCVVLAAASVAGGRWPWSRPGGPGGVGRCPWERSAR